MAAQVKCMLRLASVNLKLGEVNQAVALATQAARDLVLLKDAPESLHTQCCVTRAAAFKAAGKKVPLPHGCLLTQ